MSSTVRSPLSALEEHARDLVRPVRERLARFSPAMQARFLNTLSLMEHIGSRKIMASQDETGLTHDTLKHLAEETRHAFFFKRAAETRAGRALGYAAHETIAGASARFYMARLDAEIAAQLPKEAPRALAYLYMSLIVELRAIWFYRHYQAVLAEQGDRLSLASVLAEEEHHLDAMTAEISARDDAAPARIAAFGVFEDRRFRAFWSAIEAESALGQIAAE